MTKTNIRRGCGVTLLMFARSKQKSKRLWGPTTDHVPTILILAPSDAAWLAFLWKAVFDPELPDTSLTIQSPHCASGTLWFVPAASEVANYTAEALPEPTTPFPVDSRSSTSSGEAVWMR